MKCFWNIGKVKNDTECVAGVRWNAIGGIRKWYRDAQQVFDEIFSCEVGKNNATSILDHPWTSPLIARYIKRAIFTNVSDSMQICAKVTHASNYNLAIHIYMFCDAYNFEVDVLWFWKCLAYP